MSHVNVEHQGALFPLGDGPFAGVVLNRPVDRILTYRIPAHLVDVLRVGARVRVPLGARNEPAVGYCVRLESELEGGLRDPARVKDILEVLDDPPLVDDAMLELSGWVASYYQSSWGQALDAVVPSGVKKAAGNPFRVCLKVAEEVDPRYQEVPLTRKQKLLLDVLRGRSELLTLDDACRLAKCGPGVVKSLRDRGLIRAVKRRLTDRFEEANTEAGDAASGVPPVLNEGQARALEAMGPHLDGGGFAAFLLFGVTGSGKTEVYLRAIERVLRRGSQAIVLVPEISLTPQTIQRFRERLGKVAVLHSHLTEVERHRHWRSIASGEVGVVVGARSAVFAPARRLGLIVVDEEHEPSFKQEITPRYHGRDVAVQRAALGKIPVILGSATPSLESWHNAQQGRYRLLRLDQRVAERALPEVAIVDMRYEPPPESGTPLAGLSGPLRRAMQEALIAGGQVMLLLNRRGFHRFVLCPSCGEVVRCRACDVALTHHHELRKLICHQCEAERELPVKCPACGHMRLYFGGLGTERLEREVLSAFPAAVVRRMDSDTMKKPGSHERVLQAFREGKIDILLGTQMIAKGLDFPDVTLVGVVSADTALHLPDFRAAERTFQLVTQVAGRAGRGERAGRVVVQTFAPGQPAIRLAAAHDFEGFAAQELEWRRRHALPPFTRLARIVARGRQEAGVERALGQLLEQMRGVAGHEVTILGPAPAPLPRLRHMYRYHGQLRGLTARSVQGLLHAVWPRIEAPRGVEFQVDVDPIQML
jgi:primosomal protein N' (replication factor Y)